MLILFLCLVEEICLSWLCHFSFVYLMNIWVVSTLWLLGIERLQNLYTRVWSKNCFQINLSIHSRLHVLPVWLCLAYWNVTELFPWWPYRLGSTYNARGSQFLHVLICISYCPFSWFVFFLIIIISILESVKRYCSL